MARLGVIAISRSDGLAMFFIQESGHGFICVGAGFSRRDPALAGKPALSMNLTYLLVTTIPSHAISNAAKKAGTRS
ncbi:hypothetical protein KJ564_05245 [bacterium]|nr:hypothetical protein [bacterium]